MGQNGIRLSNSHIESWMASVTINEQLHSFDLHLTSLAPLPSHSIASLELHEGGEAYTCVPISTFTSSVFHKTVVVFGPTVLILTLQGNLILLRV